MGYGYLRRAAFALVLAACGGGEHPASIGSQGALEAPKPAEPPLAEALVREPFAELTFVPFESEAVIRVDLAALAAGDGARENALDFLLRAQQPIAWETLQGVGIRFGRELRAIYLIVGPRQGLSGSVDATESDPFLLAGVGVFDVGRLESALVSSGAVVERGPGGGRLFTWGGASSGEGDPATAKVGAALPLKDARLGPAALGLADPAGERRDALILVGPPPLVRRALAARGGETRDVRRGPLAAELLAIDPTASTWGVAAVSGKDAYVSTLMPGLVRARFHSSIAPARDGAVALRAEFVDAAQAEAFRADLHETLAHLRMLADNSPVGATLARLRETGVRVDGAVVIAGE